MYKFDFYTTAIHYTWIIQSKLVTYTVIHILTVLKW